MGSKKDTRSWRLLKIYTSYYLVKKDFFFFYKCQKMIGERKRIRKKNGKEEKKVAVKN